MKLIVLIGVGGHCMSVIEAAESAGFSFLGVLDMPEDIGKQIICTKVIGTGTIFLFMSAKQSS